MFINIARYFLLRSSRSALRFQRAAGAIVFAGPVKNSATVMDSTGGSQRLPLGAGIKITAGIEDKVAPREYPIIPLTRVQTGMCGAMPAVISQSRNLPVP